MAPIYPGGSLNSHPLPILAVSFHYPPAPEPRAVQVSRLLGHLAWPTRLVRGTALAVDSSITPPPAQSGVIPLEVPFSLSPWRWRTQRLWRRLRLPWWGRNPDRYRPWARPALAAALALAQEADFKPQVVVTFGTPWTDHLVGLALKKRLGLPWVAHFSDLWSDWPLPDLDPLSLAGMRRWEARVLAQADRVIFITPRMRDIFVAKPVPDLARRARVLAHLYDPALFADLPGPSSQGRAIRYLGDLYGGRRSPRALFQGLEIIAQRRPELLAGVRFEFYGSGAQSQQKEPVPPGLPPGLISFHPRVSHQRSLELMAGADALLLVEFGSQESSWLPSKLVEYLGAERPLLAVAPAGSAAEFITKAGGQVASPQDPQAVAAMLEAHLSRPPAPSPWGDPAFRRAYAPETVVPQFARILREAVEESGKG